MKLHKAGHARARRTSTLALPVLLIGVLVLGGCGSSKSSSSSTSTSTPATTPQSTATSGSNTATGSAPSAPLSLEANPEGQLKYNTSSLTAKAGKVTIDFKNSSPLAHNVTVEATGGKTLGATETFQGGSKTLTLELKPGTYKFFCSVPGHRMAGMEGTLVVK